MQERRLRDRAQVRLGRDVAHRVVHEHRVEGPAQPQGAHVAEEMLALGVLRAAERAHLRGQVGQRALEPALHEERVVPRPRAELEEGAGGGRRRAQERRLVAGRLLLVVGDGVEERIPARGQRSVDLHRA